ncbi:MAG: DUF433 domain-containing protein [Bryobacteraceae bacterium]
MLKKPGPRKLFRPLPARYHWCQIGGEEFEQLFQSGSQSDCQRSIGKASEAHYALRRRTGRPAAFGIARNSPNSATIELGGTKMIDWSQCPVVESIPGKVSGAWVLKGIRTPVKVLFENLEAGMSIGDVIEQFPVSRKQIDSSWRLWRGRSTRLRAIGKSELACGFFSTTAYRNASPGCPLATS